VDLSSNQITALPAGLFNANHRELCAIVGFSNNSITALSDGLITAWQPYLASYRTVTMDLSNNQITVLPGGLFASLANHQNGCVGGVIPFLYVST
jgi:Leucine-rich repeat (LRR) protein